MKITEKNILRKASKGNLAVLKSNLVDQVKDDQGRTPLHELALAGRVEVLNHPSVDQVKNNDGDTPLHLLDRAGKVTLKYLKEKYPWFKFKKGQRDTDKLITKIRNTSQSVRFILED